MNKDGCQQEEAAARTCTTGAGVPSLTRMMTIAVTITGAAECITMHSGQWSASVSTEWTCATWTKASRARRTRHTTAAAPFRGRRLPPVLNSCSARKENPYH
jgi:hypothetical protein